MIHNCVAVLFCAMLLLLIPLTFLLVWERR